MKRVHLAALFGLVPALAVAWWIGREHGRALGVGALGGYLFGATLALIAAAWSDHVLERGGQVMGAMLGGFLMKLVGILVSVLPLRFVPGLSELANPPAFLLGFAFAALLCELVYAHQTALRLRRGSTSDPAFATPLPSRESAC